jgi:hypothetical protein
VFHRKRCVTEPLKWLAIGISTTKGSMKTVFLPNTCLPEDGALIKSCVKIFHQIFIVF